MFKKPIETKLLILSTHERGKVVSNKRVGAAPVAFTAARRAADGFNSTRRHAATYLTAQRRALVQLASDVQPFKIGKKKRDQRTDEPTGQTFAED